MAHRRIGWTLLATLVVAGLLAGAAGAQQGHGPDASLSFFDASAGAAPISPSSEVRAAAERLRQKLGRETIVDIDPKTGTPREIVRLDGFLSGPHRGDPTAIARDWIDDNDELLGLDDDEEDGLKTVMPETSPAGITDVTFAQTYAGLRAFNSFIRVSVAPGGRVLNVTGSPTPELEPNTTKPRLTATEARARAMRDASSSAAAPNAELVLFAMPQGTRLAWYLATVPAPTGDYVYLVDAVNGSVLWRENTTSAATGLAWDYYPSTRAQGASGTQQSRDFTASGWLSSSTTLSGPNVRAYADLNDNNAADSGEQIPPTSGNWNYAATFFTGAAPLLCNTAAPCVWNPLLASSWTTNQRQNATQLFYFVNTFHDWLRGDPFGFTAASGNFEGNDPVEVQALDGANGPGGLPDSRHLNNANMSTRPDGQSPRMQMYLFKASNGGNVTAMNSGDDASVVYHEYTHGLTNRLVSLPSGSSGLTSEQASAMGEGWSDWYAMDYLFGHGFDSGSVNIGFFMNGNRSGEPRSGTLRTQPMNCRPGALTTSDGSDDCHGSVQAGDGGYTYGDYGKVIGYPEVHADGEIWAQMLWALREDLVAAYGQPEGLSRARRFVTEGLRLTPPAPSMLDARNAILAAETATTGGQDRGRLWDEFAGRGMGYFASAVDGDDVQPVQDTHTQPVGPGAPITGHVTDIDTGAAVAGMRVGIGGHLFDLASDLVGQTDASGNFVIPDVPQGTYPHLIVDGPGYDRMVQQTVIVGAAGASVNVAVRRDWAAVGGGASVVSASAPSYSAPCRASDAFDQSQGTGWASTAPANASSGAKQTIVRLPQAIDITAFAVDPGAICGDSDAASVGPLQIATSADGVNFAPAAAPTFTAADNHRLNVLGPSGNANGVQYVRVTMLGPQSSQGDGALYMDLAELEVYGRPAGTPAPPVPPGPPAPPASGGGGGGTPPGGGTTATPPAPPAGGSTPPSPATPTAPGPRVLTLADASVKRCRQTGRGKRVRLVCALVNASAVTSADLQLKKGRMTLARGRRVKPSSTGTLTLKLKRKLKKGRYTLTFKLRDTAAHARTITFRLRVLK
jgi:extracellular elastinolytic metalloproteinase